MGGHVWLYFVNYEPEISAAFARLRVREFEAGRYNPVTKFPAPPLTADDMGPGAQHSSIESARIAAGTAGTRSILDMDRIAAAADFGSVVALPKSRLQELYGTEKPTRQMVEANMDFLEDIERGHGIYFVIYERGQPSEILFAGYSYD